MTADPTAADRDESKGTEKASPEKRTVCVELEFADCEWGTMVRLKIPADGGREGVCVQRHRRLDWIMQRVCAVQDIELESPADLRGYEGANWTHRAEPRSATLRDVLGDGPIPDGVTCAAHFRCGTRCGGGTDASTRADAQRLPPSAEYNPSSQRKAAYGLPSSESDIESLSPWAMPAPLRASSAALSPYDLPPLLRGAGPKAKFSA